METRSAPANCRAAIAGLRGIVRAVIGLLVSGALLFEPFRAPAQGSDDAEYRVKLAFLYHFTQFIEWPPEAFSDAAAPLMICVAGPDPFAGEMEQGLRGRTTNGHPIQIKRLKPNDDLKDCHMIFVRSSERKAASKILSALKGSSTVTIGESTDFVTGGGIINLTLDQNKLRFEINLEAATQTRLKISSKLLSLAKIVNVGRIP